MKKFKVLFVCTMNRMRSRTAEDLYRNQPGLEVRSAGVDKEAVQPVTLEMLVWADVIFCFELAQSRAMRKMAHGRRLNIICLGIPDRFFYGDIALIRELKLKLTRYLGEVSEHIANRKTGRSYLDDPIPGNENDPKYKEELFKTYEALGWGPEMLRNPTDQKEFRKWLRMR